MAFVPSPSQTVGPFPHESWRWAFLPAAAVAAAPIAIAGQVFDGLGVPVGDAIVEARSRTTVDGAVGIAGFQRVACDTDGAFALAVPERPSGGAPALLVTVFARGLLCHQFTAVWLADDPLLCDAAVLAQVPESRRQTLIARPDPAAGRGRYVWDLHLQGVRETVFFDYR